MNQRLVCFTKKILDFMFCMGIIIELSIPILFSFIGNYINSFKTYYFIQCIIYLISGALGLFIVYELRKMFITVLNNNAFVDQNARSLMKMGRYSFIISILSLLRIPLAPTPATVVIIIVFVIAGLFSIVLCQVFETAVKYKTENDLTI